MRTPEDKFSSQKLADTLAKRKVVRRRLKLKRLGAAERMVRVAINAHRGIEPAARDVGVLSDLTSGARFDAAMKRHNERHDRLMAIMDELAKERELLTATMALYAHKKPQKDVIPPARQTGELNERKQTTRAAN